MLVRGSGARCIVGLVGSWGVASFENDAAGDWFLLVEAAPDPGAVMASAIDGVLSAAEYLDVDLCCEAIAAAELCACCELRDLCEAAGDRAQWLAEVDDLLSRLSRSSAGNPPSVSP